jgi:hypothetical protein
VNKAAEQWFFVIMVLKTIEREHSWFWKKVSSGQQIGDGVKAFEQ